MNSLVSLACVVVAVLAAGAHAGEAPIQKRGVLGLGYAGGYGYGHLPLATAAVSSYGYHGYHAPLAYSKVAYPSYAYSAYPYSLGYSKFAYGGYPYGYSKLAYGAYPSFGYSKVLSPYHYW